MCSYVLKLLRGVNKYVHFVIDFRINPKFHVLTLSLCMYENLEPHLEKNTNINHIYDKNEQ